MVKRNMFKDNIPGFVNLGAKLHTLPLPVRIGVSGVLFAGLLAGSWLAGARTGDVIGGILFGEIEE